MTKLQSPGNTPWWESELPLIRAELASYLARRIPAWRADHDDILNDTLLAVTRETRKHRSEFPKSWFNSETPTNEADRSYLRKLAMLILKRRIADVFRKREPLVTLSEHRPDEADSTTPISERQVMLASVLRITMSVLSKVSPEDRDLIALVAGPQAPRKVLDASERQRLHRLRTKIKAEIVRHLGADAVDVLSKPE